MEYSRNQNQNKETNGEIGFSLSELLIAISIIGILTTVALPNYTRSICKTKQSEVIAEISMIQNAIMTYTDERGILPATWDDIDEIRPIATTNNGTKSTAKGALELKEMQTLRTENYRLCAEKKKQAISLDPDSDVCKGSLNPNDYTINIMAVPSSQCPSFDVQACINTQTGTTDLEKGNGSVAASTNLVCN
jgi:prepilin-type N-terminal cleavage/methylation domain-containing protein